MTTLTDIAELVRAPAAPAVPGKDPLGDVDHALPAPWESLRTFLAGLR